MTIKKTIRIPKSELPSKNNIVSAELIDLGGKNSIGFITRYFSQESILNAPSVSLIDASATVTTISGPDIYSGTYYATITGLSFTKGLKEGTQITATPGSSNFSTGFIETIVSSNTIIVNTSGLPVTTGTITNVNAEGAMVSVVETKDPHTFSVGEDVWIDGISKNFDGSVTISKIVNNAIYYYNQSLDYPISNIKQPTTLIPRQISNAGGYIKRKLNIDDPNTPANSGVAGQTILPVISNITIKNKVVTATTFFPHSFVVGDTFGFDYVSYNASLYLKGYYQIYTVTKIVSNTSFEFKISDTASPTTNMTLISTTGTIGSITGPTDGLYYATITGLSSTSNIDPNFPNVQINATNGTGSISMGIISSIGTVGASYTAAGISVRNITGMSSTKGLIAGSVIYATSNTGSIYDTGMEVYSVTNSSSIVVRDAAVSLYPQVTVKEGTIKNITSFSYFDRVSEFVVKNSFTVILEILTSNSISIMSNRPINAGTITNISMNSYGVITTDNVYQSVIRYTTEKPHNLSIGDTVSIYGCSPGSYNVSQYKIVRVPKNKTFDISYMPQKLAKRIKNFFGDNVPFGKSPYKTDLDSKPYIGNGFINNFLYYLRYRLVSSDKNKFSAWTPIIKTEHKYYIDVEGQRLDGGDQNW